MVYKHSIHTKLRYPTCCCVGLMGRNSRNKKWNLSTRQTWLTLVINRREIVHKSCIARCSHCFPGFQPKQTQCNYLVSNSRIKKEIHYVLTHQITQVFANQQYYTKIILQQTSKQYPTTRAKFYKCEINTGFHIEKRTKKNGSYYFCVSVISINLVSNANKDHYPQVLLEECKYIKISCDDDDGSSSTSDSQ